MNISAEDRATLVALARDAVAAEVSDQQPPRPDSQSSILGEQRGCFVTLTNRGHLRGCIGMFQPQETLGEMIVEMGQAAARDPRFVTNPITPGEVAQLTVEVSVLSELEETSEPEKLRVGVDGIYILGRGTGGCFLPEVATDIGWDAKEFLRQCCLGKAGLPADAWKDPDMKVYLFTSEKFDH